MQGLWPPVWNQYSCLLPPIFSLTYRIILPQPARTLCGTRTCAQAVASQKESQTPSSAFLPRPRALKAAAPAPQFRWTQQQAEATGSQVIGLCFTFLRQVNETKKQEQHDSADNCGVEMAHGLKRQCTGK